jgi:hypothetical protein
MTNILITQEELKEMLRYDPETGFFWWTHQIGNNSRTMDRPAGHTVLRNEKILKIKGKNVRLHRLAWLYMTGEVPKDQIDHIDGDRSNNKWNNLRECSNLENSQNRRVRCTSTTKLIGVSYDKNAKGKKYRAAITVNGKWNFLGQFATAEEAHAAYVAAKPLYHKFNPTTR